MSAIRTNLLLSATFHCLLILAFAAAGGSAAGKSRVLQVTLEYAARPEGRRGGVPSLLHRDIKKQPRSHQAKSDTPPPAPAAGSAGETSTDHHPKPSSPGPSEAQGTNPIHTATTGAAPRMSAGPAGRHAGGHLGTHAAVSGSAPPNAARGSSSRADDDSQMRLLIRRSIEKALIYPPIAQKRRLEGTTVVSFAINVHGFPDAPHILQSSGFSILDNAAQETIRKAAPFPVLAGEIEVPITFRLRDR